MESLWLEGGNFDVSPNYIHIPCITCISMGIGPFRSTHCISYAHSEDTYVPFTQSINHTSPDHTLNRFATKQSPANHLMASPILSPQMLSHLMASQTLFLQIFSHSNCSTKVLPHVPLVLHNNTGISPPQCPLVARTEVTAGVFALSLLPHVGQIFAGQL